MYLYTSGEGLPTTLKNDCVAYLQVEPGLGWSLAATLPGSGSIANVRLKVYPGIGFWTRCTMTEVQQPGSSDERVRVLKPLFVLLLVGGVILGIVAVGPVAAHDSETVDDYELTFGGADEPVITGEWMWLELEVVDQDDEPVPDQADTLTMDVEHPDGMERNVELAGRHGEPAYYEAPVVFTEPGTYTIHIEGTIEDSEVHVHFEKEVQDRTQLEFPASDRNENQAEADEAASLSGSVFGFAIAIVALGVLGAVAFVSRRD